MKTAAVVVHDDERMLALVTSLLEGEGYVVYTARGAYDVLAPLDDHGEGLHVRLVIVGLTAVDERDLELIGLLRRRHAAARLVLLFPTSLRDRAARALDRGADGYLPEPFYPAELIALARRAAVADAAEPEETVPGQDADEDDEPEDALAQLAAGIVHALRNPLQILELLLAGVELGDPLDVDKARAELARVGDVASALTLFTVGREAEPRAVDLNALVRQAFLGRGALDGTRPALSLAASTPVVLAQPESLHVALDALRRRAERAAPEGGLEVTTRVRTVAGVPSVDVEIVDQGAPLPPSRLASLFDPFPDPSAPHETLWLELAAAADIVRCHGGCAEAHRAGDRGTRVRVTLPLHRNDNGTSVPAAKMSP